MIEEDIADGTNIVGCLLMLATFAVGIIVGFVFAVALVGVVR